MDKEKKEKIEEQLRLIIAQQHRGKAPVNKGTTTRAGVRVIRRRKGHPDMKII